MASRRLRSRRLPRPQAPDPAERAYLKLLARYQRAFEAELRAGLKQLLPGLKDEAGEETPPELRMDAVPHMDANAEKAIRALFELVQTRIMKTFPDPLIRRWAGAMVGSVNKMSKRNATKVMATEEVDVEPLMRDGELTPFFTNVVDENVGLIRSINEDQLPIFKNKLVAAVNQDMSVKDIQQMIQDHFGKSANKARLIARDQVGKLNGRLNQYRQQQLGGKRYVWRTVEDRRVRDDHKRLDGKTFSWDAPPIVDRRTGRRGNPGVDFQCRCYAEMVIDDVLAD